MKKNLLRQLIFLTIIVVIFLTIYLSSQQVLRQGANDPQIQLAQDSAQAIASGQIVSNIVPVTTVNLDKSLAVYYIVYDKSDHVVASSARLNGQTLALPDGVLSSAKSSGIDSFTWQPTNGVRSAVVVVPINNGESGYVLVGRSLKQVEERENTIELISFLGLLGSAILLVTVSLI